jgi:hypothetical protein
MFSLPMPTSNNMELVEGTLVQRATGDLFPGCTPGLTRDKTTGLRPTQAELIAATTAPSVASLYPQNTRGIGGMGSLHGFGGGSKTSL